MTYIKLWTSHRISKTHLMTSKQIAIAQMGEIVDRTSTNALDQFGPHGSEVN